MKTYENFLRDIFKKDDISKLETQEEIDKQLVIAVDNHLWWEFLDAIKKGANPNQTSTYGYTLLMCAINDGDFRMIDELVKHGADVHYPVYKKIKILPKKYDLYKWAMKMLTSDNRLKFEKIILRYHPDFFEERELRKETDKYNL